jgi:hypothetical protein
MGYQNQIIDLFLLTLVPAFIMAFPTEDEYLDPNPIISGFSTCYIDLILLGESQEFREPPVIPVAVTYSATLEQTGSIENEDEDEYEHINDSNYNATAISNMKRIKINCLALFIFSPNKNLITIKGGSSVKVQVALNRYFSSSRCCLFPIDLGSTKNAYLTLVKHQNFSGDGYGDGDHERIISRWGWENKKWLLPIFYLSTNLETTSNTVSLSVELLSPCIFYNSVELHGLKNIRQEFDNVFSIGQRSKCTNIMWRILESETKSTRQCVSFAERLQFYEQQTSAIVSIAAEPFANSTAVYVDHLGGPDESLETQKCMELSSYGTVVLYVGFEAAREAYTAFPINEIVYEEAYNFLTCDGAEDYLSFEAYASPFLWNLWAGIVIISLITLVFLIAFVHYKNISASIILLIPSVFFEQPPQFSTRLLEHRSFKYLLIFLLLATTVLTNSYKSIVTTDLTAPFSSKRVETFDEAMRLDYKIFPPLNDEMVLLVLLVLSKIPSKENIEWFLDVSHLTEALKAELLLPNTSPRKRIRAQRMLNLIAAPEDFPNVSFQKEISKCNKSIYVDHDYQLDQFLTEVLALGNGNLINKLYKGRESFQKQLFSWRMHRIQWDRAEILSKRWNSLSHSGIFTNLDYVYKIGKVKTLLRKLEKLFREKEEEIFRPLTLNSTVMSIFIVYLACVSFCICFLMAEKIHDSFCGYKYTLKTWMLKG